MPRSWPLLVLLCAFCASCAAGPYATAPHAGGKPGPASSATAAPPARWAFFAEAPADLWSTKIADWQARQLRDAPGLAELEPAPGPRPSRFALLWEKSDAFRQRERRAMAARIAAFSQAEARRHYRWDPETSLADDPWPTSFELYERNGDDCDGLDLIAYDLLREFGFPERELFRVIVQRESDGANHMATLWFEDPDDPWVIDATGAITRRMRRFSELLGWTPFRVFDEHQEWGVARSPARP